MDLTFLFKFHRTFCGDPGRTSHFGASDLGLHCLPMSHKKNANLIWVKCSYCEKTSSSGSILKTHMANHTGQKPYNVKHSKKNVL